MSDDLTLKLAGQSISGWDEIRVTRSLEHFPSSFDIRMSERYAGELAEVQMQAGDACQILMGSDLVITGYIDRLNYSLSPGAHDVRVLGRGKCADLVDCAAYWPGGQIMNSSVLQIAQNLAKANGITVTAVNDGGAAGQIVPQFNVILTETSAEIIERCCRWAKLLAYDGPDGNLILSGVGNQVAASGFQEGVNVQEASATYSMDQRYSDYIAFIQSVDVLSDIGLGGNLLGDYQDKGVTRPRRHVIIAESGASGQDICTQRAIWEAARRYGRSNQVSLVTDSWRDLSGALYSPNTLVPLMLPTIHVGNNQLPNTWVIAEVIYRLAPETGTTCELLFMPPDAFKPEPILLRPFKPDV